MTIVIPATIARVNATNKTYFPMEEEDEAKRE
jgi:hypothetical protein